VQQKTAAEGQIYSITSSAMVRLFSEQAFKNLGANYAAVIVEGA